MVKLLQMINRALTKRLDKTLTALYPDQEDRVYAMLAMAAQQAEVVLFGAGYNLKMIAVYPRDEDEGYDIDILTDDDEELTLDV